MRSPARSTNVEFCDDLGNPTLRGNLYCAGLPAEGDPSQQIELHAVGSGGLALLSPGVFRLSNCAGLTLPPAACTF